MISLNLKSLERVDDESPIAADRSRIAALTSGRCSSLMPGIRTEFTLQRISAACSKG